MAIAFTSCKSSESAYKKAYEKAKSQEAAQQSQDAQDGVETTAPVVAPVQTRPANETSTANVENVPVRQERVSLVNGKGLKSFSVVVGSFSQMTNAEGLQKQLVAAGYDAQIVRNGENNMYRVISATFDSKADAVKSRDNIKGSQFNKNADAWLLYNVQ
jgi:cell division protein FtsN